MLELKTFRVWFGATLVMCALSYSAALRAQEKPPYVAPAADTYHIHVGDVVEISVLPASRVVQKSCGQERRKYYSAVDQCCKSRRTVNFGLSDVASRQTATYSSKASGHNQRGDPYRTTLATFTGTCTSRYTPA
jgi:hypothetical protein